MKPNFKIIDKADPEFVNVDLRDADLKEISELLQKRKSLQSKIDGSKASPLKLVKK